MDRTDPALRDLIVPGRDVVGEVACCLTDDRELSHDRVEDERVVGGQPEVLGTVAMLSDGIDRADDVADAFSLGSRTHSNTTASRAAAS